MHNRTFNLHILIRIAVLVAIAIVLKVGLSFTVATYRFTFYDIPLMIIGMMFGPLAGAIGGFTTDWINILMPNLATGFNLFTVSSMLWGIIPGLFLFKRNYSALKLILVVTITSLLTFGLNSLQLYVWMQAGMFAMLPVRLVTLLIKLPIQVVLIDILYHRVLIHDLKLLRNNL
ncbi:MAG: folate family ECF transporter S component [Candidatus Izimaplasma sp.]|nr:folate family ECF transporter S component [Candidatus Izimaplasma bacterium]